MKLCAVILIFLTLLSCKQTDDGQTIPLTANKVLGTWQLKSSYISPGGATEWKDVENGDFFKFTTDGTFSQTNTFEEKYNKFGDFELVDGTLTLRYQEDNEDKIQKYSVQMGRNTMTLSPAGPSFCVEPCLIRYLKLD